MERLADVHVGDPGRVAVDGLRGDVVDGVRALVRGEGPPPRRRVERDLAAAVVGVLVEGADGVDGGELHELEPVAAARVAARRHAVEQGEEVGRERGGHRVPQRVEAAGAWRTRARELRAGLAVQLGQPQARREHRVGDLEAPVAIHGLAVRGAQPRRPAPHHLVRRQRDAEDATGVQALHQPHVPLAQLLGREIALLLVLHEVLEVDLVQRRLEGFEPAVLGQHDAARLHEAAVGVAAGLEVAGVVRQGRVREDQRDAQLVAAPDVEVEALRVQGAGCEARVEGGLVASVVGPELGRLLDHPGRAAAAGWARPSSRPRRRGARRREAPPGRAT